MSVCTISSKPLLDYLDYLALREDVDTDLDMAKLIGVNRSSLVRWRQTGTLSIYKADAIACGLGMHIAEIWGREYRNAEIEPSLLVDGNRNARRRAARLQRRRMHKERATPC